MRVAVIGGTGCGGRAVVEALRAAGHEVRSIARGICAGPAPDFVCDRRDHVRLGVALRDVDAVVDQVAYNAEAVGVARRLTPRGARYLLISSAIVYGAGRRQPYAESDVPSPATPFAQSKRAAESELAGRPGSTCLRIGALYGPGHAPMTPLGRDPSLPERLAKGESIVVPEPDPAAIQPWFAEDHGRLIAALLDDPSPPALLNAAGPETLSWKTWLRAWAAALDHPEPRFQSLTPAAFAAAAPDTMRPYVSALLNPPQLDLQRLHARFPELATTTVAEGTRRATRLVGLVDQPGRPSARGEQSTPT